TSSQSVADEGSAVDTTPPSVATGDGSEYPGPTAEPATETANEPAGSDPSDPSGGGADAGSPAVIVSATTQASSDDATAPDDATALGDAAAPAPASSPDYDWATAFTQDQIRTFSVSLPEEEWQALRLNARDKEYVPAALAIDGEEMGSVGLRFKGGWTLDSCFTRSDEPTCAKM